MSIRTGVTRIARSSRRVARRVRGQFVGMGGRRRRRRRGISAAGIRAARRLVGLLRDFQSALPRGRRSLPRRRRRRLFGDPEDEGNEEYEGDPEDEEEAEE